MGSAKYCKEPDPAGIVDISGFSSIGKRVQMDFHVVSIVSQDSFASGDVTKYCQVRTAAAGQQATLHIGPVILHVNSDGM